MKFIWRKIMSCYSNQLKDICSRTLTNLNFIQTEISKNQKSTNAYEVTQLILSCYGIIVNIKENCEEFKNIENHSDLKFRQGGFFDISLNSSNKSDWGIPNDSNYSNIGIIIYNLRNATSHLGISANGKKDIESITFEFDEEKSEKGKIRFSIQELETFLRRVCDEIM